MFLLVIGLLLWGGLHFIPTSAHGLRSLLIDKLGDGGYRGLFSVGVVASIVLMVFGYRAMPAEGALYRMPEAANILANLLMVIAFILFGAAKAKTNIKHYLQHPQLTSIIVWAVAHLIANGEPRAILLFGGLGAWALIEIVLINGREDAWQRPQIHPWANDTKPLIISLIVFVVVLIAHPYLFGVSPIPFE